MKSRAPAEDPAAKAAREQERRLAEIDRLNSGMEQADGLTADLREVYGLKRLGRAGAVATPGVQPQAAPTPTAQRNVQNDRSNDWAAINATRQQQGKTQISQNRSGLDTFTTTSGRVASPDYKGRSDGLMQKINDLYSSVTGKKKK